MSWAWLTYSVIAWLIRPAMVPVVLRRQFAPGAAWAWLGIVFLHPYVGVILYMLFGENRLGPRRTEFHRKIVAQIRNKPAHGDAPAESADVASQLLLHPVYQPMARQAEKISGLPIRAGNSVEFLSHIDPLVNRLVQDIDAAAIRVHLLYYIFAPDTYGDRVATALEHAAARGVKCRVLVDAVAGREFFRSGLAARLVAAKVAVAAAMPVAPFRRGLARMDLRNHRKLAIIDDQIAYAGSHNIINPDYGGRRGAPWVDVTGRFTGAIVAEFQDVFREDWAFEAGDTLDASSLPPPPVQPSDIPMQVVPTGPSSPGETYRRLFLAAIQCARTEVILTTPYFVPDEPTLVSLIMAADRGVDVKLIVPDHPDHFFTAAAGRAHFAKLMDAGVKIFLYRPGLLHAKTTTVDDAFALFGSANLDVRSFNLNFELSVLMYGASVTENLRAIQTAYLADSNALRPEDWAQRPALKRYADGAVSLLSPLL